MFLAASDSRVKPEELLGAGAKVEVGADGKAHGEILSDRVVDKLEKGVLRYQGPKGVK